MNECYPRMKPAPLINVGGPGGVTPTASKNSLAKIGFARATRRLVHRKGPPKQKKLRWVTAITRYFH